MNLEAEHYNPAFITLAFRPENQAERAQLSAFKSRLACLGADLYEWNDMHGDAGWGVTLRLKPAVLLATP